MTATLSSEQRRLLGRYTESLPAASREPFVAIVMKHLRGEVGDSAFQAAVNHGLDVVKETLP